MMLRRTQFSYAFRLLMWNSAVEMSRNFANVFNILIITRKLKPRPASTFCGLLNTLCYIIINGFLATWSYSSAEICIIILLYTSIRNEKFIYSYCLFLKKNFKISSCNELTKNEHFKWMLHTKNLSKLAVSCDVILENEWTYFSFYTSLKTPPFS